MSKNAPDIVVTSALPYANGPIHIGHLVEYIQTDIYVRFLKLSGKDAIYCCAGDTHGAPIEINAAKQGIVPELFVERYITEHQEDFARFHIAFDSYHSTNSDENRLLAEKLYAALKEGGHIYEKDLDLTYCTHDKRFLPDRYVKGTCPKCAAPDQYGDVCEKCNATYAPTDLVSPYCTLCSNAPVRRTSTHLFFRLGAFAPWLKQWLETHDELQDEVKNQILRWVDDGLQDWCISRDGPYFGFKIPGTDKYFYVWLDAPVGYISSLAHYLGSVAAAEQAWNDARVVHFIGKDIIYFHLLFWPAVLHAAGWKVPDNIVVHGHLTVDGEKMSKSRGTLVSARDFAALLPDPEFLRFYYAGALSGAVSDIDLSLKDLAERVNKELVSNVANLVYRSLSFVEKHYAGELGHIAHDEQATALERAIVEKEALVLKHYAACEFRKAVQEILHIASLGNAYMQERAPWKDPAAGHAVLTTLANVVKDVAILLAPILPEFSRKVQEQLGLHARSFKDLGFNLERHKLGTPAIVWTRIAELSLEKKAASTASVAVATKSSTKESQSSPPKTSSGGSSGKATGTSSSSAAPVPVTPAILDLIVAQIVRVEKHPQAEKLYIEELDDGSGTPRTIVSGLVPYYAPHQLVGKRIVLVKNLKPAKLRGILSQGMLLAAQAEGTVEVLEAPHVAPGTRVTIEGFERGEKEISVDEFFSLKLLVDDHHVTCDGARLLVDGKPLTTKLKEGKVQ